MAVNRGFGLFLVLYAVAPLVAQEYTLREAQALLLEEHGSKPYLSQLADINGDGFPDFFAGTRLYLGVGDGTFNPGLITPDPIAVTGIGDIDGDGAPDIFAVSPYFTIPSLGQGVPMRMEVHRNVFDAFGNFQFPVLQYFPMDPGSAHGTPFFTFPGPIADVDGDTNNDLLAASTTFRSVVAGDPGYWFSSLAVARGRGDGTFAEFQHFAAVETTNAGEPLGQIALRPEPALADLNRDGFLDVVFPIPTETDPGLVTVLLNDHKGGFLAPISYATLLHNSPSPDNITVSDVDGDRDLDLVIGHGDWDQFSVLLNRGDGTFDPPIAMPEHGDTGVVPEYAFSADINHDGSADAIVFYGSRVGLFFNILNPAARVQAFIDGGSLSEDWRTMMRVGDFNNDGLLDVLLNGTKCERYDVPCHFLSFIGEFAVEFLRGDANADGLLNISDASTILGYLFLGSAAPSCLDRSDANDDGKIDLTDAIYLLSFLFLGGPPPLRPFPSPGIDPTIDSNVCTTPRVP